MAGQLEARYKYKISQFSTSEFAQCSDRPSKQLT